MLPPHGALVINAKNDRSSTTGLTARCHIRSISWRGREVLPKRENGSIKNIKLSLFVKFANDFIRTTLQLDDSNLNNLKTTDL